MNKYFQLIRVHHWIKNLYIFIPIFFSKNFQLLAIIDLIKIFIIFSLAASIVYIFNDLLDIKKDRKNPWKKNRPLANKQVSINAAKNLAVFLIILLVIFFFILSRDVKLMYIISTYFFLNLIYSINIKYIFPLNVIFLSLFFYLRLLAGNIILEVDLSIWLTIFVITSSTILILGKKITDLEYDTKKTKKNKNKLQISLKSILILQMIVYLVFSQTEYSLEKYGDLFPLSFLFVFVGTFRYLHILKQNKITSDQISLFLNDKIFLMSILSYVIFLYLIIY